ncbi:MAG: hypothetical protein QOJ97_3071 [Solirubrobacteraceae bacterium]|jgi:hypothetical protein|nr:hypothetical protein [Solirubrobacteraceae bacterium]
MNLRAFRACRPVICEDACVIAAKRLLPTLLLAGLAALAASAPAGAQGVPCPPLTVGGTLPGCGSTTNPPSNAGGTAPGGSAPAPSGSTTSAPAAPVASPEVGIEDENVIFSPQAAQVAAQWRALGVDYVRVMAYWDALSPATTSPTMPAGFDPGNPNSPGYNWGPLDAAIAAVRSNGMRVMLTVNQSGPRWASLEPNVAQKSWKPNPVRFAQFAGAVARRYRASVDRYLVGSEPNQLVFLAPQSTCVGRRCTPAAPHAYRNLLNAAYPAIKANDPGAQLLIGELAPVGSGPSRAGGLTPMMFIRELACVDARFRNLSAPRCRGFRAVRGDGFGYHPYMNTKTAPTVPQANKELAKIGDLPRLLGVLDRLSSRGRLRSNTGRFRLYLTEFGYITRPPNPRFGVSLAQQARFLAQSAYIVWTLRSRVKLLTQYQWNDDPFFQTGLRFNNGQPKTSFFEYPHPFFVDTARGLARAVFWGQARPDNRRSVTLQIRRGRSFSRVAVLRADAGGYWASTRRAQRGATYRYQYVTTAGTTLTSGLFTVPRR